MTYRGHWIALLAVLLGSFAILGGYAPRIYSGAPPIPARVVGPEGETVLDGEAIRRGQNVWQSMGGQEVGSIWGHGAYVAPDWTADWLHREARLRPRRAGRGAEGAAGYAALAPERQAALRARLDGTDAHATPTIPRPARVTRRRRCARAAFAAERARTTRTSSATGVDAYAIPRGRARPIPRELRDLAAFFWWTSWAALDQPARATAVTYTQNWPHEPLVGNRPTGGRRDVERGSFVLPAGRHRRAGLVPRAGEPEDEPQPSCRARDPLFGLQPDAEPARHVQVLLGGRRAAASCRSALGAVTAHYGVEGQASTASRWPKWLPYAVTRTWHTQLGIFWIATAWLATGLFVAPGGRRRRAAVPARSA